MRAIVAALVGLGLSVCGLGGAARAQTVQIDYWQYFFKERDAAGNLLVEGMTADLTMQDQHWVREVLTRQFGGTPYTPDNQHVACDNEAGIKAVAWYAGLVTQ
jgi:hypothetical protein